MWGMYRNCLRAEEWVKETGTKPQRYRATWGTGLRMRTERDALRHRRDGIGAGEKTAARF